MEENSIKDIWKLGVNSNIKSYSNSELNEIIVKSARKSMKPIQLGGIFQFVVIAVMIYLILTLLFRDNSVQMKLLNFAGLIIIFVSSLAWKRSDYKMNKYKYDMPVKEWLEYRIEELNKTIYTKKKYNIVVMCLSFLLGFGFHVVNQIILKAPFNLFLSGSIFVVLIIYFVIVARSLNRKYKKALKELKDLYKQFEESN